jgi:hypothetical protein
MSLFEKPVLDPLTGLPNDIISEALAFSPIGDILFVTIGTHPPARESPGSSDLHRFQYQPHSRFIAIACAHMAIGAKCLTRWT